MPKVSVAPIYGKMGFHPGQESPSILILERITQSLGDEK